MRKIIGFRTLCVGLGIWVGTVVVSAQGEFLSLIHISTLDIPACIKDVKAYTVPVDLDGMNESMNTFNTKSENRAD